ncbi:MAG: T9SS type A sorting domain-containing protein [Flavobacteriales bacterium]|nr:T9SS type A sorting domain-containing protein [Flavobacteriales bacterium]
MKTKFLFLIVLSLLVSSTINAQIVNNFVEANHDCYRIDSIHDKPPISLQEWTIQYLKTLKGLPTGNLRKIGERKDQYDMYSSSWNYDDSLSLSYDTQNGNVLTELFLEYNQDSSAWFNSFLRENTYNTNGWLIQKIGKIWNGTSWINSYKENFNFNAQGLVVEKVYYEWNGSEWLPINRITNTYNSNQWVDTLMTFIWDNLNSQWIFDKRNIYQYDAHGNCTELITQRWIGSYWLNELKFITFYTADNQFHYGYKYFWNTVSNSWNNSHKDSTLFISNTNREEYQYLWDVNTSNWKYNKRKIQTFTTSNILVEQYLQEWSTNSQWINNSHFVYTLDAQENYSTYEYHEWHPYYGWIFINKELFTFNNDNYLTYQLKQKTLYPGQINWVNEEQKFFWYEVNPFVSIADVSVQYQVNIFPNPAKDYLLLTMKTHDNEDVEVIIYNLNGAIVYNTKFTSIGQTTRIMDVSNLLPGTYFLQIKTIHGFINNKLIKS